MPDFSIIIPAYNEEGFLGETLRTARQAMDEVECDGEIIVVDNNSTDRTSEVAQREGADLVVFEPHNQIAKARNKGAASASSERFIFVDADTLPCSETLDRALNLLRSETVVGGGIRVAMDRPVSPMVAWITRSWNRVSEHFGYAAGSFFFCRRDAFESVGGFDESVYAGEEIWLAKRLKRWARKNGMTFEILTEITIVTSGRISEWFSTKDFVMQLGLFFIFPWATKSRRLCGLWYRRPDRP